MAGSAAILSEILTSLTKPLLRSADLYPPVATAP